MSKGRVLAALALERGPCTPGPQAPLAKPDLTRGGRVLVCNVVPFFSLARDLACKWPNPIAGHFSCPCPGLGRLGPAGIAMVQHGPSSNGFLPHVWCKQSLLVGVCWSAALLIATSLPSSLQAKKTTENSPKFKYFGSQLEIPHNS